MAPATRRVVCAVALTVALGACGDGSKSSAPSTVPPSTTSTTESLEAWSNSARVVIADLKVSFAQVVVYKTLGVTTADQKAGLSSACAAMAPKVDLLASKLPTPDFALT